LIWDWRAFIAEIKPERRRKDQAELRGPNRIEKPQKGAKEKIGKRGAALNFLPTG
jgi:hypothetical protein